MTPSTSMRLFGSWWRPNGHVEPTPREDSFSATLPSTLQGADFQASFTVRWMAQEPAEAWNLVRGWLQHHARAVAARWSLTQLDSAQNEMHYWLGRSQTVGNTAVQILSCSIRLTASAEAVEAAARADELKRQLSVVRHKHDLELAHLRYLRDEIFSQPSVARAYWLSRHPDALNDLLDDRFERAAAIFGHPDEARVHSIAAVLDEFLRGLNEAERRYLLEQLAQVFTSYGRADLNDRLSAPGDGVGAS